MVFVSQKILHKNKRLEKREDFFFFFLLRVEITPFTICLKKHLFHDTPLPFAETAQKISKPHTLFPVSSHSTIPFFSFNTSSQGSLGCNNLHTKIFLLTALCQLRCKKARQLTELDYICAQYSNIVPQLHNIE